MSACMDGSPYCIVSGDGDAHEGTTMSAYMDGSPYSKISGGTDDDGYMTMSTYMQECTSHRAPGDVLAPGGMDDTTAETAEPYVGIDDMSPKEMEERPQDDIPYGSGGKDNSRLDELIQSLRKRSLRNTTIPTQRTYSTGFLYGSLANLDSGLS